MSPREFNKMSPRHGISLVVGAILIARCGFLGGISSSAGGIIPGAFERWRRVPQEEPILISRLPASYPAGAKLSLGEVVAFEVRRFRRANARQLSNESVVPLHSETHQKRRNKVTREVDKLRKPVRVRAVESFWSTTADNAIPGDQPLLAVSRATLASTAMQHIWVSEHDRFLFCAAPGVASRTWISFLRKRAGASDFRDLNADPLTGQHRIARLVDYSDRDKERLLMRTDFHRVLFVRNPYLRATATFLNATQGVALDSMEYKLFMSYVRGEKPNDKGREVSFLNFPFFLSYLAKQHDNHRMHPLFAPQKEVCGVPGVSYDLIGRHEDFDAEIERILRVLNIDPTEFPRASELGIKLIPKDDPNVTQLLSVPKHRNRMAKLYADDFQGLGYERSHFGF